MPIEENIVVANGKQWGDTTEGGGGRHRHLMATWKQIRVSYLSYVR